MSLPPVLDYTRWESIPKASELSFDKVPKKHSPLVILGALSAVI